MTNFERIQKLVKAYVTIAEGLIARDAELEKYIPPMLHTLTSTLIPASELYERIATVGELVESFATGMVALMVRELEIVSVLEEIGYVVGELPKPTFDTDKRIDVIIKDIEEYVKDSMVKVVKMATDFAIADEHERQALFGLGESR